MGTPEADDAAPAAAPRPGPPQRRYRAADEPRPGSSYVTPEPVPQPARPRRLLSVVRGAVALALVGGLLHLVGAARFPTPVNPWATGAAGSGAAGSVAVGRPAGIAPTGEGGYVFLAEHDGRPVGFDPCVPVHYVMQPDGAPPGAEQLVQDAAAELSAASGLVLVFEGATDEVAGHDRPPRQPERYGDGWAPVLISWSSSGAHAEGTPAVADPDGRGPRIVTGHAVVDADTADPAVLTSRLLHQLGHLAGLDEVDDPDDVMHEQAVVPGGYTAGALRGLHVLGQGPCFG